VYDFTNASDREIASLLKKNNNACGRFTVSQLNRDLVVPKEKSSKWMAASAAIISFLTIGLHNSAAQQTKKVSTHSNYSKNNRSHPANIPEITVTGRVIDADSISIPFANVRIIRNNEVVSTDIDGNFKIKVRINEVLEVSFTGMLTKEIIIEDYKNLVVALAVNPETPFHIDQTIYRTTTTVTTGGYVTVPQTIYAEQKRTFFGRAFHSIGNIFR
jgi:hypothetical protein